ncbi:uncharacterized protein BCR38DRAFT_197622 [Pseudomassariella vexata]|uniref:Heterokaryon incompatibility domain-containing protein n=1 Tax=Pseudomassariella vexata TaxID=1141098 RepID=A0A1Y2E3J7_9PEZI|nr:uncharacterized protein BCR38DRAFT_197622 [Pseudomassariella vexata]ORY65445.1 hypothetical protein BCR38DRAFT_197622 [Pseudomassariella vexata]
MLTACWCGSGDESVKSAGNVTSSPCAGEKRVSSTNRAQETKPGLLGTTTVNYPSMGSTRQSAEQAWLKRTWVIQETVMAKKALVICDQEEPSWARLMQVIHTVRFAPHLKTIGNARMSTPQIIQPSTNVGGFGRAVVDSHWGGLLTRFRGCEATDSRDNVHALLGMTDRSVTPDYTSQLQRYSPIGPVT